MTLVQGQSYRINASVGLDITDAISVQIGYRPPGTPEVLYWPGTVDDPELGTFHVSVPAAENMPWP